MSSEAELEGLRKAIAAVEIAEQEQRRLVESMEPEQWDTSVLLKKADQRLSDAIGEFHQEMTMRATKSLLSKLDATRAKLERAEGVGRQAERERCINICRGIKQEHNTMMNSLLECDMRFEGGASSAAERCADEIADGENTGDFTLDRLRKKTKRAASREEAAPIPSPDKGG